MSPTKDDAPRKQRTRFSDVFKTTLYIGSGDRGRELAKKIEEDCQRMEWDVSPLLMYAYEIFHDLDSRIGEEAEKRNVEPAQLINEAFAYWLKNNKK